MRELAPQEKQDSILPPELEGINSVDLYLVSHHLKVLLNKPPPGKSQHINMNIRLSKAEQYRNKTRCTIVSTDMRDSGKITVILCYNQSP